MSRNQPYVSWQCLTGANIRTSVRTRRSSATYPISTLIELPGSTPPAAPSANARAPAFAHKLSALAPYWLAMIPRLLIILLSTQRHTAFLSSFTCSDASANEATGTPQAHKPMTELIPLAHPDARTSRTPTFKSAPYYLAPLWLGLRCDSRLASRIREQGRAPPGRELPLCRDDRW